MVEFKEWPKMARFSRDIVITEKIDGTNASIFIQALTLEEDLNDPYIVATNELYTMRVGSRTRWITPSKTVDGKKYEDNGGFAKWCFDNQEDLFTLGEGHHFGEWWGSGIQSGYGLPKGEKRFSLFNVSRWADDGTEVRPKCCHVVPVLYKGEFLSGEVHNALRHLQEHGSVAAPGFMKPEGIIVWHTAANIGFKKTIEKDGGKWNV